MRVILFIQVVSLLVYAAKPPIVSKKSKLCGNEQCDEVLFKAKVKRVMGSNHEAFLSLTEGAVIDVTAVKFSDRTDLMEGVKGVFEKEAEWVTFPVLLIIIIPNNINLVNFIFLLCLRNSLFCHGQILLFTIGTCKPPGRDIDSTCIDTPGGYYFEVGICCADMSI
ncbi:hypothetical protein Y032_0714g1757 [Ancylostoma ceylanicum]|uniref:Uncharacterized protein n=1 Tax=Ancylostoma ceylanicum TaxID=53326 RepID=A0A016WFU9_9BILA|nr:hypothetical protein Y032_0714g1757 [Ancylostoma ceylanicum]